MPQPGEFQHSLNASQHDLRHKRLFDKVYRALLEALYLCVLIVVDGQEDDGNIAEAQVLTDLFQDVKAVHTGHMEIQQDHIRVF